MALFITSFVAGVLTVLAPCILPLLPVTLGGALTEPGNRKRPFVIIASLAASVLLFTLLLKGSTALINVSPSFWSYVSAAILILFGLSLVFPYAWARIVLKIPGHNKGEALLATGYRHRGKWWADALVGAALGPVFTTCSPTFFIIIATVLPQSLATGIVDLLAYIAGLSISLLIVAFIGQKIVNKLEWATDPGGAFRKALGVLFIIIAVGIVAGWDKKAELSILNAGFFDVTKVEQGIRDALEGSRKIDLSGRADKGGDAASTATAPGKEAKEIMPMKIEGEVNGGKYIEIVRPAGFVNSEPFRLADLVGKKVILVDFIDYSCINCQRTFPYMRDWWSKYKDAGLAIVAIHTPEFSFEKDIKNVTAAAKQEGLGFPIVLDNDYATWNAYRNQYWPHKYIIDIKGDVVYEHIGEGAYDNTEMEIVKQLNLRRKALGLDGMIDMASSSVAKVQILAASPETYFGAWRNSLFGNGRSNAIGTEDFELPLFLDLNRFFLGGRWRLEKEFAAPLGAGSTLAYSFLASKLYLVAQTSDGTGATARVLIDGKPIEAPVSGADVKDGVLKISGSRLYKIYESQKPAQHRIDIIFDGPGARVYTFTFG